MIETLSWFASAATIVAAIMTAANLGTRFTGWGFAVFALGSMAWASVGLIEGKGSLAVTNGFLILVNLVGVWRWLGRQARYEKGSAVASARSRQARAVPTLFSSAWLLGAELRDDEGAVAGTIIDAMIDCETMHFAYVVVGQSGIGGTGETLHALAPRQIRIVGSTIRSTLTSTQIAALPAIDDDAWPLAAPFIA